MCETALLRIDLCAYGHLPRAGRASMLPFDSPIGVLALGVCSGFETVFMSFHGLR